MIAQREAPRWTIAPPRPAEGVVSWNINTACNYRCSYCTQRFMDDRGRWSRDTERFLEAFGRLAGPWEVKLSGGEPFVHPTLLEIVAGLAAQGRRVSVVTNLSATPERLAAFVEAARGRVGVFSCSLHLEYVDHLDEYVHKAQALAHLLAARADAALPPPSLCVTTVATRAAMPRLQALAGRFAEAGLTFKVQPEKQEGEVVGYEADEAGQLATLLGRRGALVHRYSGRLCWAGARYFILDDRGRAYRCYPARRRRLELLGDFLSPSFRLRDEPAPCQYATCNCTVPIERRMMAREDTP